MTNRDFPFAADAP